MTGQTALVLGATGGIGGAVAAKLLANGWTVRGLHRDTERAAQTTLGHTVEWIAGDAMDAPRVVAAAKGASLIVHAVNPPGYQNWDTQVLPMLDSTIQAARASDARILLPGTVYNFGPDQWPNPIETSPHQPTTRKGRIRARMEQNLRDATSTGVRSLVVRAGDFFGPEAISSWFAQGLIKAGKPVQQIQNPSTPGIGHQWAYVPDLAEAMVRLIEAESLLADAETVHFRGHWDEDGTAMVNAILVATDGQPKITRFPWWQVMLASPFVPFLREMREMRYLWQIPLQMGNARLVELIGEEPHTPLGIAVHTSLSGLGCLEAPHAAAADQRMRLTV